MDNLSHQAKFTNQSWSFQVSHMEEDHHQNIVMNSPPWTSTFPLHSLPILPPSHNSSTQMALLSIPAPPDEAELHAAEEPEEELGAMKEMMYKIAAMQPVDIDPATIRKPKRRNVRISDDPQSVAARHRRERISEKIRILQRLVPGGTKMDTASMLDEAIRYVKFLRRQIRLLQSSNPPDNSLHLPPPVPATLPSKQSPLISINNSSKNNSNSLICFNQPHEEIRE